MIKYTLHEECARADVFTPYAEKRGALFIRQSIRAMPLLLLLLPAIILYQMSMVDALVICLRVSLFLCVYVVHTLAGLL